MPDQKISAGQKFGEDAIAMNCQSPHTVVHILVKEGVVLEVCLMDRQVVNNLLARAKGSTLDW